MEYKTNLVRGIANLLEGMDLANALKSALPGPMGIIIRPAINSFLPELPNWLIKLDENADAQAMIVAIARNIVQAGDMDIVEGEAERSHDQADSNG